MKLPVLDREAAFTEKAKENLRTVPPQRLTYNWLCNVCRMAFGFPRAYMTEGGSRGVMVAFNAPLLLLLLAASGLIHWGYSGITRGRGAAPPRL